MKVTISKHGNQVSEVSQQINPLSSKFKSQSSASSHRTLSKTDRTNNSPSERSMMINLHSIPTKRRAHELLENKSKHKVLRQSQRNKKQIKSTSNESSARLPPGNPFKVLPISKETAAQNQNRKAHVSKRTKVKVIPNELLPKPPAPTNHLIPEKRLYDDDFVNSINPSKRITRSMTKTVSSLAGEICYQITPLQPIIKLI